MQYTSKPDVMLDFARVGLLIAMLMFSVQANERAKAVIIQKQVTIHNSQLTIDKAQSAIDNAQLAIDNGQLTMDNQCCPVKADRGGEVKLDLSPDK